jgi:hypothetical protein
VLACGSAQRPPGRESLGVALLFLIFGTRMLPDVIHYPDLGEVLYDFEDGSSRRERNDGTLIEELRTFEDGSWRLQRADGTLIKEGNAERGY